VSRFDAFDARTLPADARERKCIHCGDNATIFDLCGDCRAVYDFASEHPVPCRCGPCLSHAKIEQRRALLRPGVVITVRSLYAAEVLS
jgi:hypothetical protein